MTVREIVLRGSNQEIAQTISRLNEHVLKAIVVVESQNPSVHQVTGEDDAWTLDFRRWAASHRATGASADVSREALYEERLG